MDCINDKGDIFKERKDIGRINDKGIYSKKQENAILDVLMIKVIYSKKPDKMRYIQRRSGKCDIGRINDKGDIFKEVRKMRYWTY